MASEKWHWNWALMAESDTQVFRGWLGCRGF